MEDEKSESRTDLDREFASTTTLHGIGRVINSPRISFKLVWLFILLVCLGVCAWQITDRFERYFSYDANSAVSVQYVGNLFFPAVTICNFNRYRKSALTEADIAALDTFIRYSEYDYDYYDDGDIEGPMQEEEEEEEPANFSYTEFTQRTGFVLDSSTLLDCEWRGKKNSCSAENFTHVFTSFGNCWTFNSGDEGMPLLHQIQPGSGNGIKMIIDIQQPEYTELLGNGNIEAGLKILIHDQQTPANVDSEGLAIAPGVHAFVGVRKIEYNNLQSPWGECESKNLTYYERYTLEGCDMECRAKQIYDECNCKLVRHPGNKTECSPKQVTSCAIPVLAKLKSGAIEGCNCSVPCNYSEFRPALSIASLPNNNILEAVWDKYGRSEFGNFTKEETMNYIRDNWILLDVYYETMNFEKYQQSKAITPSALISDIGGQLGLFLGASFITMAEILDYLGRKAGRCMTRCFKRDTVQPRTQQGEETINIKELSSGIKH